MSLQDLIEHTQNKGLTFENRN